MRSRQGPSTPEPLRMRVARLETTSTSDLSSTRRNETPPNMTTQRPTAGADDTSTPSKFTDYSPATSPSDPRIRSNSHDVLSKAAIDINGRAASPKIIEASPLRSFSPDGTINGDTGASWSSAVGGAAAGGKSGRVIEKLMLQSDSLRRELKLVQAKLDEEQRRSEAARATVDSLRSSNENWETMCESYQARLARRDRKIEDFKSDLATERSRRETAELERSRIAKDSEDAGVRYQQEVEREKERADNASTQYETLKYSFKHMKEGYQRQLTHLHEDIGSVRKRMDSDQEKIKSLEIVCLELRSDHAKAQHSNQEIRKQFDKYKEVSAASMRTIVERAESNGEANEKALQELHRTMGEMRYVTNVKRSLKEIGNDEGLANN